MSGVYIVGIGPGHPDWLTPVAKEVVAGCQVLIGGVRNLALFPDWSGEKITIADNLDDICNFLAENHKSKRIGVVVTGDPGLFSMLQTIRTRLPQCPVEVVPGISSLQYLAAKIQTSWHTWRIISLHGKDDANLRSELIRHRQVCLFTGGKHTPEKICQELLRQGVTAARVIVGENLSDPRERIVQGTVQEISRQRFESLSLMLIARIDAPPVQWPFQTPGIPDALFVRGDVPMTKEEVRAVSLTKLRLQPGHLVYDIGAGTGSVAVECALQCREGQVYAIEKAAVACDLIAENANRFGVFNLQIIPGEAPGALAGLPEPDRVFIGGSGRQLLPILATLSRFRREIRVVINAVTLETCHEALTGLAENGFDAVEVVNVALSRGERVGGKHLLRALNPVFVINAQRQAV